MIRRMRIRRGSDRRQGNFCFLGTTTGLPSRPDKMSGPLLIFFLFSHRPRPGKEHNPHSRQLRKVNYQGIWMPVATMAAMVRRSNGLGQWDDPYPSSHPTPPGPPKRRGQDQSTLVRLVSCCTQLLGAFTIRPASSISWISSI
ncbi:hypothetical protein BDW67DRAFT_133969 [Aspergillus spinulosporus]